jgi:hypothetical protein
MIGGRGIIKGEEFGRKQLFCNSGTVLTIFQKA